MATITIDLNSEAELKDLLADLQPGDVINLRTTIKSKDDQTVGLTLVEATEGEKSDDDDDEMDDESDDDSEELINEGKEMAPPPPPSGRSNY